MKEQTREEPEILAAAERQMHAWAIAGEQEDRAIQQGTGDRATRQTIRFVAISREVGAGGGEIGRRLGERLGWEVFDKNLLDHIADRFHLSRTMLDLVDETCSNWVHDLLGTWMDRKLVPHAKYVACLGRVVLAAAQQGQAVFVGRGAQFLLPRRELLAVRAIASLKYRVLQIMETKGVSEADARRHIEEIDRNRCQFVEHFFHQDIADPHNYDLVVNVERCGVTGTVEAVLAAMRMEPADQGSRDSPQSG